MKTHRNSSVDVFVGFPKFRSFKSKLGTTNKCIIAYKVGNYLIFAFVLGILSKVPAPRNLPPNCLSEFDRFVGLALKGLSELIKFYYLSWLLFSNFP